MATPSNATTRRPPAPSSGKHGRYETRRRLLLRRRESPSTLWFHLLFPGKSQKSQQQGESKGCGGRGERVPFLGPLFSQRAARCKFRCNTDATSQPTLHSKSTIQHAVYNEFPLVGALSPQMVEPGRGQVLIIGDFEFLARGDTRYTRRARGVYHRVTRPAEILGGWSREI